MKIKDINENYDAFIHAARLQGEAIKVGDSKVANRQYHYLKRIFMKAKKLVDTEDTDSVKTFYVNLRKNQEANVQLFASAHSLALGIDISEAENILGNLAQQGDIGILRLNAEMTLKVWEKQGYLNF